MWAWAQKAWDVLAGGYGRGWYDRGEGDGIRLDPSYDFEPDEKAHFAGGGVRDTQTGKARFDLMVPKAVPYEEQMLTRWADHMVVGAQKYEDRNWEKFEDQEALDRAKASAFRHFMQWLTGEDDEDHAAAVFFNITAAEYVKGILDGKWEPNE